MTRATALLLTFPWLCGASGPPPSDLQSLVDAARGAPAEFAADALIRVASLDKLDKTWRVELLEDAFRRASAAKEPYKLRAAVSKSGGQAGFLDRAYSQELDTLSLEMRAVEGMLPLDPAKARELFLQVPEPRISKVECKDALVADVSSYYTALGHVAARTYSAKEIEEEEPFKLFLRHVVPASPLEVGPLAQLLATATLPDSQLQALATAFAGGLKELAGDDRAFTYARPAATRVNDLKVALSKRNLSPVPLVEAYRAYLVRQMTAVRCTDNTQVDAKVMMQSVAVNFPETQQALNAGIYFNETLRVDPVAPLTPEEQMPSKTEGQAEGVAGCSSPECTDLAQQYRALIFKPEMVAYSDAEKSRPEWHNQLKQYLSALAVWKQDTGASAAEHFRFKCAMYSDLLAIVPNGSDREMVLRATLDYLKQNRLEVASPQEWFLPVNALIGRVALDPLGLGPLMDELRESGDQVIALYARLEKTVPRTPDRILPLL